MSTLNTPQPATGVLAALEAIQGLVSPQADLRQDSRTVKPGDVFVALPGARVHGEQFTEQAFAAGASVVLLDAAQATLAMHKRWPGKIVALQDLSAHLGELASAYYGYPSRKMRCVGITGTNGKSTCVLWLAQLMAARTGQLCALLGTLGLQLISAQGELLTQETAGLTTPQVCDLHRMAAQAVKMGARYFCMEVSSIGIAQQRIAGFEFEVGAFTNLTQDHLDFHGTMQAYSEVKYNFISQKNLKIAVLNAADPNGKQWLELLKRKQATLILTGVPEGLFAERVGVQTTGVQAVRLHYGQQVHDTQLTALGKFNVDNLLTVLGCGVALGFELSSLILLIPRLHAPLGRMQVINTANAANEPLVIVDYAHTPDGLDKALTALKPLIALRGGALHLVFGCGGDRDPSKRALMGQVAARTAHYITVTSDNPRSEDPERIAQQVVQGIKAANASQTLGALPVLGICLDRSAAIRGSILDAKASDVILIAGKGHESTQTIGTQVFQFSDVLQATLALNELAQSTHASGSSSLTTNSVRV